MVEKNNRLEEGNKLRKNWFKVDHREKEDGLCFECKNLVKNIDCGIENYYCKLIPHNIDFVEECSGFDEAHR